MPFTNTFFMKYPSLLSILCATCLLCLGCHRQPSPSTSSLTTLQRQTEERDLPRPLPLPDPPILPTPVENPFWNTESVDISQIASNRKLISFTFDDAPSRTLENILATFAAYNEQNPDCMATATVFYNGGLFDNHTPALLATSLAMGFELGNHTQSHLDLTTLDKLRLLTEIDKTDEALEKIDGKPRHLLRAPFGKTDDLVKEVAPAPLIDWTIDTLDWTGVSADTICRSVFDNLFSGAIVLMHDGYPHTVDALKILLPRLKEEGYQVVTVSQMAKAHGCTLQKGKVYIRARKQVK